MCLQSIEANELTSSLCNLADPQDLSYSCFRPARKWTEMDRNRYIIVYGVWSKIEQPTNHVKTSLIMDLWSVTNAQNVGINENETIHAKATW